MSSGRWTFMLSCESVMSASSACLCTHAGSLELLCASVDSTWAGCPAMCWLSCACCSMAAGSWNCPRKMSQAETRRLPSLCRGCVCKCAAGCSARWWHLAEGLTASCVELWTSSPSGLAPEFSKANRLHSEGKLCVQANHFRIKQFGQLGNSPSVALPRRSLAKVSAKPPHDFIEAAICDCIRVVTCQNVTGSLRWEAFVSAAGDGQRLTAQNPCADEVSLSEFSASESDAG